eukprot:gene9533-19826_t
MAPGLWIVLLCCIFFQTVCLSGDDKFFSASRQGDVEVLTEMLKSGYDVSSVDTKGNSAIIIAAGRGRVEVLKVLLAHGANVESFTTQGLFQRKTVLMWASSQGRPEAVQLLIQVILVGYPHGRSIYTASRCYSTCPITPPPPYPPLQILSKCKRALMWASSQGRLETVAVLLEAGADVNNADNDGITALMWAAGSERDDSDGHKKGMFEKATKGQIGVVKLLLVYGARVDMQDNDGITALMYASFNGHVDAVDALLVAGADPSIRNFENKSAVDLARGAGYPEVARILLRGPKIMDMNINEVVDISACGWLLSVLRYSYFRPGYNQGPFSVDAPSLSKSCLSLKEHGLDGTMGELLYLMRHSSVITILELLGPLNFASRIRARDQLTILLKRFLEVEVEVAGSASATNFDQIGDNFYLSYSSVVSDNCINFCIHVAFHRALNDKMQ